MTFDHCPIGMAVIDSDVRIVRANRAWCRMLGYEHHELEGQTFDNITPEEDLRRDVALVSQLFAQEIEHFSLEKRFVTKNSRIRWVDLNASPIAVSCDVPSHAVVTAHDITARKEELDALAYLATHDHLTGLASRSLAFDRISRAQKRGRRTGQIGALFFIDIDKFKAINDELGHETGDSVLVEVAKRMRAALRPCDSAARFGGDEFVVCCEDLGNDLFGAQTEAFLIAERMMATLCSPVLLSDRVVPISVSIGLALIDGRTDTPEQVLHNADAAMYLAKDQGRGQWAMGSVPSMNDPLLVS